MKTNNDFIKIKKWQFWDIYPKIVGENAFPITNNDEWERYVERFNYRSHLIALVPNPELDPWGREMLPYITEHDNTPRMWGPNTWPHPPLDDMNPESCMTVTSVNGFAVRLYRRKADWIDPWRRLECRKLGITLSEYYDLKNKD
tara:strand:- start:38 stop:469 length:432 start_codon:yes stop_codon:yes gene_type:complete